MPIFKQEVKTTMDDEKKAKFHTFESGKKSDRFTRPTPPLLLLLLLLLFLPPLLMFIGGRDASGTTRRRRRRRRRRRPPPLSSSLFTTIKTKTILLMALLLVCCCLPNSQKSGLFAFGQRHDQQKRPIGLPSGEVIELNDNNFDTYINKGSAEQLPVIIDVYATWCVHCKQLEPVWEQLAQELKSEVYVGKIDGEKERALANRLSANKGFPTIILLHQNKMRLYTGERSVEKLTHFCRKGWREVKAEPWHKTANNWFGHIFGYVHKVPGILKSMYSQFSKDYSDTQILFMALSVPVISGMLLIWVADAITVRRTVSRSRRYVAEQELIRRRAAQAAAAVPHPHAD